MTGIDAIDRTLGETIERLADLISNAETRIAAAAEERASYLAKKAEDAAALRVSWAEDEVRRRDEVIAELRRQVDAGLRMRDQAQRERDQARAAVSATGISEIDRTLGDMIDHALAADGAKLLVEYCDADGDEPEDFGCFVATLTGPDDELIRDAIGDTAMEAVRSLRPIPEPDPTAAVDEQPF
jgi:hypothetical protein